MRINEEQRKSIYDSTREMIKKTEQSMGEIEKAKNILGVLCEKENMDTYYTWTIGERLNEAKIRLDMSLTRIEEFRREADSLDLSTSGFY